MDPLSLSTYPLRTGRGRIVGTHFGNHRLSVFALSDTLAQTGPADDDVFVVELALKQPHISSDSYVIGQAETEVMFCAEL
jgi:hypothetical protein